MNLNQRTFEDLTAYRDDLPIPEVVKKRLDFAMSKTEGAVLDYGCGTGRYSKRLTYTRIVYGVEPVESAFKVAQNNGLFRWNGEKVNAVICVEVFEHLVNPEENIKEIYNALNPGGYLFLTVPNAAWWKHRVNLLRGKLSYVENDGYNTANNPHIRMWTPRTMKAFLRSNGFEIFPAYHWGTYAGFPGGSQLMELTGNYDLFSAGVVILAEKR